MTDSLKAQLLFYWLSQSVFFHQILLGGNPPSFLQPKFCAIQYYKFKVFMNELSDVSSEETSEKQYEDHCEIY